MTFTLKNICAVTAVLHFVCLLYNCFILMPSTGVRPVLSHRAVVDVELSGSELFYCFFDPQPLPTSPTKKTLCFTTTSLKLWLVTSRFAPNSGLSGGLSRCR